MTVSATKNTPSAWALGISLGVFFWVIFMLAMRTLPSFFLGDEKNLAILLAAALSGWLIVEGLRRFGPEMDGPDPVILASATALLMDGIVMTWFAPIYSAEPAIARNMAGFLLFGVGATLICALVRPPRALAPADRQR
jgi:hypothetical protein